MNTLILRKEANKLENIIRKANRALLEVKIMQAKLEIKSGMGKVYSSGKELMRDMKRKAK